MSGMTRWDPFEETFNFQREMDRLFNRFWSDLPTRTAANPSGSFQVTPTEDAWRIDIALPGIDPQHVHVEAAGHTLSIRAEEPTDAKEHRRPVRYEQTLTVPHFLDLDRISASYRYGMLHLTVPLKDSVKPRQIQIENVSGDRKQLTAA